MEHYPCGIAQEVLQAERDPETAILQAMPLEAKSYVSRTSYGEVDDDQSYGPHLLEREKKFLPCTARESFCTEETLLHVSGPAPGRAVGAATQPGAHQTSNWAHLASISFLRAQSSQACALTPQRRRLGRQAPDHLGLGEPRVLVLWPAHFGRQWYRYCSASSSSCRPPLSYFTACCRPEM